MNLAHISKLFLENKLKNLRKHCIRCVASVLLLTMLYLVHQQQKIIKSKLRFYVKTHTKATNL